MQNDSFNLPAPPGFRGMHPDLPVRIYRRHLPHWRQEGATYFLTFRLADSIPQTHKHMKGYVARQANQILGRSGRLWAQESYDRIIRDAEHLYRVVQYIGRNPANARLPERDWHRWLHPLWEDAGWRFEDP